MLCAVMTGSWGCLPAVNTVADATPTIAASKTTPPHLSHSFITTSIVENNRELVGSIKAEVYEVRMKDKYELCVEYIASTRTGISV
jgi:hypothetical protein